MKKLLIAIGLVLGFLVIFFVWRINVLAKTPEPEICTECPVLQFEATRLVCPEDYKLKDDVCVKRDAEPVKPKEEKFYTRVPYEKSEDPNKCHKPSPAQLNIPEWARAKYERTLREWLDAKIVECPQPTATPTPVSTIRWCFPNDDKEHPYVARAIPYNEKPDVGFPWEEGMDKWCEKPEQCTTEKWSCEACQNDPNEYKERLGICYDNFVNYCGETYSCDWVKVCPVPDGKETLVPDCYPKWVCKDTCEPEPTPTPSPEPTPTPEPEVHRSEPGPAGAPQCGETPPVKPAANVHVYRKGATAIVKWYPTEGNQANIYYYNGDDPNDAHAVRDTANDGYEEINELGGKDWTFGVQQANGCAGGEIVWVVDGNTRGWVLFR